MTRRQVLFASAAWAMAVLALLVSAYVAPALPSRINIRWAESATSTQREQAERDLSLASGEHLESRTWSYVLADHRSSTIAPVLKHPLVEDTHHIDPRTLTLEPDASGRPRWVQILVQFAFVRQFSDWLATAALLFGIIGLIEVFPVARRSARSVWQTLPAWGVSTWEAVRRRLVDGPARVNVCLVLLAPLLLALLSGWSGRIDAGAGYGFDGSDYASLTRGGGGNENTSLRPLIPYLNRPLYMLTGDALLAYTVMDYAYAALLALALCLLFDRYSEDRAAKVLLVINVLLCIPMLKMTSYYPVLIDLGACAVLTLAVYLIVAGRRSLAGAACVAAVLSREFGLAAVALGVARDLRMRAPLWKIAATYAPAVAVWVGWRSIVIARFGHEPVASIGLLSNLRDWQDPQFALFFAYFLLTIFGGISLFVFVQVRPVVRHLWREPEWGVFLALIVGAAAVGRADIWRYLAYLVPAFVVLFAVCAREADSPRQRLTLAVAVCAATLLTQRPWQTMDLATYFRDWFPYYVVRGPSALGGEALALWPLWTWRFATAGIVLAIFALWPLMGGRARSRAG